MNIPFEIQKRNHSRPNHPNRVELLVESRDEGVAIQVFEEGLYAGDVDALATIQLTRDETLDLRAYLDELLR